MTSSPPKVLIIDDEPLVRRTIERALRNLEVQLHAAEDGEAGLEQIQTLAPDVVVLDLRMPVMDGLQVLKQLELRADSPLNVIVLTGHGDDDELRECYALGARAFLKKPFNPIEMRALVQQSLAVLHAQQALLEVNQQLEQRVLERTRDLNQLNDAFRRFVPRQYLERAEASEMEVFRPGHFHVEPMTVLFLDLRDFTNLTEPLTPLETLEFLNRFFGLLVPVIEAHDGFVDKFMGDGLMALFDREEGAAHAVQAALQMHEQLQLHNAERESLQQRPLRFGVGIHTGLVVVGTIGSESRLDSTAIGDTINSASRLEQLTKQYGSWLLITETTRKGLDPQHFQTRMVDCIRFRGKRNPLRIYEVFDHLSRPAQDLRHQQAPLFNEGMALYQQGQFEQALEAFERCLAVDPEDTIVVEYLRRCHTFLKYPPEHWEGIMDASDELLQRARRRTAPRLPFMIPASVQRSPQHVVSAQTLDLSRYGLRLALEEAAGIGEILMVRIDPDHLQMELGLGRPFEMLSQVAWTREAPSEAPTLPWQIGVEFVTLDPEQEIWLNRVLINLSENAPPSPSSGVAHA